MNSEIISKEEKIKPKIDLNNLKSNYFLRTIFNIIKKNKSLTIVKYNKKLQKRLNINIKNYKKYSQLFTPIEIEIKLGDDNDHIQNDKFINISR